MAMQLHFEPDLDYQLQAIEAVCDLFKGQERGQSDFSVQRLPGDAQARLAFDELDLGTGNRLRLLDDELLANLRAVQLRHGLAQSTELKRDALDLTIEMETGTGKTYVYLRTAFELHRRYGFTKFVVVVPSVAIREGVHKTIEITREHFRSLYAGVPVDAFVYDSTRLGQVRHFATSAQLQLMIVTVGAINKKDVNQLYKAGEKTGDERPIDLIRATRPILIVDEPQSVDGGLEGAGRQALQAMQPLCTLRYSATHKDTHHRVFRLDAIDAYERRLVKQIEVAAATVEDAHNRPFVRLVKVTSQRRTLTARLELDVQARSEVVRREVVVHAGDDLEETTGRAVYRGCRVGELQAGRGKERCELRVPGAEVWLRPGESWGDADPGALHRLMIRRTIREHLDKARRLRPQGIKVLSLFFVDEVAKYRQYDAEGRASKGEYARVFEEEYAAAVRAPAFAPLFEGREPEPADAVHEGYFSIDKRGTTWSDTSEGKQADRENAERAYALIMRDKERLLSFAEPLAFIFSHSALREGWDNPNVFQLCALRTIRTERERRQSIGRGLRLCVNQRGERVRGFDVNTLTVIANESYAKFAAELQSEIEAETGLRFGVVEQHLFAGLASVGPDGAAQPLGADASRALWDHLRAAGLIDAKGQVQDALRQALRTGTLPLPPELEAQREGIVQLLKRVAGRLEVKDANDRRPIPPRQVVLASPEFQALWARIRDRTTYRVAFDNERLVADCARALADAPPVGRARVQWRKAELELGKGGVQAREREGLTVDALAEGQLPLPDLLTELQDRTQLTRRTILRVVQESGRLADFSRNPQAFLDLAAQVINRCKGLALVDGIRYERLGEGCYYAQELFVEKELTGYLSNLLASKKSVYEQVVYDSETERAFAEQLELSPLVRVYAKLPGWFVISTPLGGYNPDWAVLVTTDAGERVYFVVETKSSAFLDELRTKEAAKSRCGERHFEALREQENPPRYRRVRSLDDLLAEALS